MPETTFFLPRCLVAMPRRDTWVLRATWHLDDARESAYKPLTVQPFRPSVLKINVGLPLCAVLPATQHRLTVHNESALELDRHLPPCLVAVVLAHTGPGQDVFCFSTAEMLRWIPTWATEGTKTVWGSHHALDRVLDGGQVARFHFRQLGFSSRFATDDNDDDNYDNDDESVACTYAWLDFILLFASERALWNRLDKGTTSKPWINFDRCLWGCAQGMD